MPFTTYTGSVELDEYEDVLTKTHEIITRVKGLADNSESDDTVQALFTELVALYPDEKIFNFTYTQNKEQIPALLIALKDACDFVKSMERSNVSASRDRAHYYSVTDSGYTKLANYLEYNKAVYLRYVEAGL